MKCDKQCKSSFKNVTNSVKVAHFSLYIVGMRRIMRKKSLDELQDFPEIATGLKFFLIEG